MTRTFPALLLVLVAIFYQPVDAQEYPQLTALNPRSFGEPAISSDNKMIVYSEGPGFARNLYLLNKDSQALRQITDNQSEDSHARWSPDSEWIVFQREDTLGNRDLWMIRPDGSESHRLTETPNHREQHPRFSQDGKKVIFDGNRDEPDLEKGSREQNYEIYELTLSTGEVKRLTHNPGWDMYPSFNPDGTLMAFRRTLKDEEGVLNYEIFVKDLMSGEETNITNNEAYDSNAHWSPAGDEIVFSSVREGASDIYLCSAKGEHLRKLTQGVRRVMGYGLPTFSFDGKLIVASRYIRGATDIALLDLTKSN